MKMTEGDTGNLIAAGISYSVSLAIAIAFTPFLITSLGVSSYGYIPLALAVVGYASFLTQSLSVSLNRKLLEASQNIEKFSGVLVASLLICGVLVLAMSALFLPLIYYLDNFLDVERSLLGAVQWVFLATLFSTLLSVFSTPFNSVIFSEHKHYIVSLITAFQGVFRVGLVVALFVFLSAELFNFSIALVLSAAAGFLLTVYYSLSIKPGVRIRTPGSFKEDSKDIMTTGGGVLLTQFGTVVIFSADLIAVNIIFGVEETGKYAAAAQWALAGRTLSAALASVFASRVIDLYFNGSQDDLVKYVMRQMRILGVCLALPVGFVCATSPTLLGVWVGDEIVDSWPVLTILLLPVALNGCQLPLLSISVAANRVYYPGLVTMFSAAFLLLCFWGVMHLKMGSSAIAFAVSGILVAKYLLFSTWYSAKNLDSQPLMTFYSPVVLTTLCCAYTGVAGYLLCDLLKPSGLIEYVFAGILASLVYLPVAYFCLREER